MQLGALTINYKIAAVEIREKLAVEENKVEKAISFIKKECRPEEIMLLSTCNRVEIYLYDPALNLKMKEAEKAFLSYLGFEDASDVNFQHLSGREAAAHIFRVTASLEAMVIGEPQITGQVKDFYFLSAKANGCGFFLNNIMSRAFSAAKRVRNETEIAKFAVSISFAAVELAKKIFLKLQDKVILIIGAGEMTELAASHLLKAGCSHLLVTNRTFARAISLAEKFNGSAVRFEYMSDHLENADIIISSTGSKDYIITRQMIPAVMKKRKGRPMFLIDIAVPRDIDPEINKVNNAYVYDIDDLQSVVDDNIKTREEKARKAVLIIDEELEKMYEWLSSLKVVPTIKMLREKILGLADQELEKGLKQIGGISPRQEKVISSMLKGLANKILHSPTVIMKQKAKEGKESLEYLELIKQLFNLSSPSEASEASDSKIINLK